MFANKNLNVIAYVNGFTMWHYKSTDDLETIMTDNYFQYVYTLGTTGDLIIVNCSNCNCFLWLELDNGIVKTKKSTNTFDNGKNDGNM